MNKREAIQAMLDGEKVTIKKSGAVVSMYSDDQCDVCYTSDHGYVSLFLYEYEGWEIYKEPAKKVKMWQWVIKSCLPGASPRLTEAFCTSWDVYCLPDHFEMVQRADWTEIEVEVTE